MCVINLNASLMSDWSNVEDYDVLNLEKLCSKSIEEQEKILGNLKSRERNRYREEFSKSKSSSFTSFLFLRSV